MFLMNVQRISRSCGLNGRRTRSADGAEWGNGLTLEAVAEIHQGHRFLYHSLLSSHWHSVRTKRSFKCHCKLLMTFRSARLRWILNGDRSSVNKCRKNRPRFSSSRHDVTQNDGSEFKLSTISTVSSELTCFLTIFGRENQNEYFVNALTVDCSFVDYCRFRQTWSMRDIA